MKIYSKILALSLIASLAASCDALDTNPNGGIITEEQNKEVVADNPDRVSAQIAGLSAVLIKFGSIASHADFGYASACIMWDSNSADMVCANIDFNHYSSNATFKDRDFSGSRSQFMWNLFYSHIKVSNDILSLIPKESVEAEDASSTSKAYRAQALASRAWDYFNLAQLYQFTYVDSKDALCVPILTEKTTPAEASNNPRATVSAVYELIMADLNEAIVLFETADARGDKSQINKEVALGIRARVNLVMQNWAAAAADAAAARAPYTLLSKEDVFKPYFNDASIPSYMWANIITADNRVVTTGIINWPSMLSSFSPAGYTGAGCYKRINIHLYNNSTISQNSQIY